MPDWAAGSTEEVPKTINDATFVESRLHSLRTRQAAAYKGIYALMLGNGLQDWMEDKSLDKVQYSSLAVDIHHIFPQKWCAEHDIDDERRESIVNKTAISAFTNRAIGGAAPSSYLSVIERRAKIPPSKLDALLAGHMIDPNHLRADNFDDYFAARREELCQLVESALGKFVPRDLDEGHPEEASSDFASSVLSEVLSGT